MSFTNATNYFKTYRENREKALQGMQPIEWFMNEMNNVEDIVPKFERSADRADWTGTYMDMLTNLKSTATMDKPMRIAQRINSLARWERDIRILYIAAPNRIRSELDRERYEYCRVAFVRKRLLRYVAIVGD
jgi:hypothetical protein